MPIQWREQFNVGTDLIDSDHQYLLEIINKAERSLLTDNFHQLTALLDELARYGKMHFEREEIIARAPGYPIAGQLRVSHGQPVAKLAEFCHGLDTVWTQDSIAAFTSFLRDWLLNHVIKEDMLMKPWLTKHSLRFDPR
ncbi:bacteriohemerythrin [Rhodoferax antarcticus]|uniref:Hemerythrin-like metal-binding domain protein n=1 Tax=Rhodoferax antarcticus ANT.BR TaxID=1111071 RepID=A0A1Q8YET3_9BURK|nr:hemerythrin domain-containing protein [Rhodoferax antarcticus]APW46328.1 hypothetical protein RA876_08000 [Rhodoferax antarcticus]MCW2312949.1 hemerythrin [Rhodoferax antarcticus]OLP06548.1 hemerythrin-like metal-binding domain protein [Rhodoferax antarcticus ANT.BR]